MDPTYPGVSEKWIPTLKMWNVWNVPRRGVVAPFVYYHLFTPRPECQVRAFRTWRQSGGTGGARSIHRLLFPIEVRLASPTPEHASFFAPGHWPDKGLGCFSAFGEKECKHVAGP